MEERSTKREVVDLKVTIHHREHPHVGEAYNLSIDGCMIAFADAPAARANDEIFLELADANLIAGSLAWIDHGLAGVKFAEPLAPSMIERLKYRLEFGSNTTFRDRFGRRLSKP